MKLGRGRAGGALIGCVDAVVERLEGRLLRDATPWAWNAQMIHQDDAVADFPFLTGAGQSVVVIDTGALPTHPSLTGADPVNGKVSQWVDFYGSSATPIDDYGHGTGVAGIVVGNAFTLNGTRDQGVAQGANLIVLRTDGNDTVPWATEAQHISDALDWVIAHQAQYGIVAVNMSTGGNTGYADASLNGDPDATIDQQLSGRFATLAGMGVYLVAAAGNDGQTMPDTVEYPAADPNVVAVSSVDSTGNVSDLASAGGLVDLLAPGENITMPYYFAVNPPPGDPSFVNYGTGTSFAAPQVTGAAVLLKQVDPTLTPAEITDLLQRSGTQVTDAQTGHAFKLLNVDAAIKLAYAERDDLDNHTTATATPLSFDGNGVASLSGLKSLAGAQDDYSFTLGTGSSVDFAVDQGLGSSLLNASGGVVVADLASSGAGVLLPAGTYYVRVTGGAQTLDGTYGVTVTAAADDAANANPATSATTQRAVYDANGTLHLAWQDTATRTLQYATRDALGNWSAATTVDAGFHTGDFVSIAIDPADGNPGIAYYDAQNADLKYAHFNGSTWDVVRIDSNLTVGQYPSLAYTTGGAAEIAYFYKNGGALKLATQVGAGWSVATVDTGNVGRGASLVYDASTGQLGVGYDDVTHGWFKYAYYKKGWHVQVVDATTRGGGGNVSLQFDPTTHQPEMSYYDAYNADLKFARYTGTKWVAQALASKRSQGLWSTLLIRAGGAQDVVYYNATTASVVEATSGAGGWTYAAIGSGGMFLSETKGPTGTRTLTWCDAATGAVELLDE